MVDVAVVAGADVRSYRDGAFGEGRDEIAAEEPLEIRIERAGRPRRVAYTMRTPGEDGELALGFLYAEGVIRDAGDLDGAEPVRAEPGRVTVRLAIGTRADPAALDRHFWTTSACGVCGKRSLENLLRSDRPPPPPGPAIPPDLLLGLPAKMREAQGRFAATGGLHAAALFDGAGHLVAVREDVGRHNALDKVVGASLLAGRLPLAGHLLLVSGRASFELVQKAAAAGAPLLAAVSAPSTLAIATAERAGLTLVAFLREGRFNVYAGAARVTASPGPTAPGPGVGAGGGQFGPGPGGG